MVDDVHVENLTNPGGITQNCGGYVESIDGDIGPMIAIKVADHQTAAQDWPFEPFAAPIGHILEPPTHIVQ
jgi:hypothetical protein